MNAADFNRALRIYLGFVPGGGATPYGGAKRIRLSYGASSAETIKAIEQLIRGLFVEEEVVRLPSLAAIADFVANRASLTRPELDGDVCRAIGNYVSYSYK